MAKVMAMAGAAPLIPSSSQTFSQFQLRSIPLPFCGYTKRMHLNLVYPQETVIQPHTRRPLSRPPRVRAESVASDTKELLDVNEWNKQFRDARLKHLEAQALDAFKKAVDTFRNITFPCALIAGDVVILDLLERLGFLSNGKVKVVFIDTFHLFPETYSFLKQIEARYNFQAHIFHAAGVNSKSDYLAKYDSDFYLRDIDEYDKICKVEPFDRALATLEVELMINGRRRDHGADRAHLEVLEGGKIFKLQPLAYWEFRCYKLSFISCIH
ncbi:hypothetical protein O6H91_06G127100 [Diphasiastrum complanatum]|uniref:Uncharacterized protein n=2 Tax=Diphasiastrum complanatum TaxID=34168 RepID=A0ACC2A7C4_DIPCM|nr:hypothetical protein O6H91_24G004900 [Diphasiastrum complanatum]KAJ7554134.1 hypothetical protein O6H91_06G127100 [Diphasiastrum complanatum]